MNPVTVAREAVLTHNAIQKGGELASFLALLMDLEPRIVVEIGADAGGTLWAWQQLPTKPRVIGITMTDGPFGSAARVELNAHGCEVIFGNSHDPATRKELVRILGQHRIDMLFIDGDHTFDGVKQDFEFYQDLVRHGGIVAFHDICDHPSIPQVKVKAFWDSLVWQGPREEIITDPPTWGGIGVLRVPERVRAAA